MENNRRTIVVKNLGNFEILLFSSLKKLEEYFPEWDGLGAADIYRNIGYGLNKNKKYTIPSTPNNLSGYVIERNEVNPVRKTQKTYKTKKPAEVCEHPYAFVHGGTCLKCKQVLET